MENLKSKQLSFKKVMLSMGIIMLVWTTFWYPFDYFIFPENLNEGVKNFLGICREYLRMAPAIFFIFYYSKQINLNFKDLFSLKFNYKWFLTILSIFVIYIIAAPSFMYGRIYIKPHKMLFYDIALWLSLGLCQELVFRGWSFNAFKSVTSQKNAVILSSAFFAVSHWFAHFFMAIDNRFNLANFISVTIFTFVFGVFMCFIMIKTKDKSIVPLIILHAVWDFLG